MSSLLCCSTCTVWTRRSRLAGSSRAWRPDDDQIRLIVAQALERTSRSADAIAKYGAILARSPDDARAAQGLEGLGASKSQP
jgi:hypothetical protein